MEVFVQVMKLRIVIVANLIVYLYEKLLGLVDLCVSDVTNATITL